MELKEWIEMFLKFCLKLTFLLKKKLASVKLKFFSKFIIIHFRRVWNSENISIHSFGVSIN